MMAQLYKPQEAGSSPFTRSTMLFKLLIGLSMIPMASSWTVPTGFRRQHSSLSILWQQQQQPPPQEDASEGEDEPRKLLYDLGLGKNHPVQQFEPTDTIIGNVVENWNIPEPVRKPVITPSQAASAVSTAQSMAISSGEPPIKVRRMVAKDNDAQYLRRALWDEMHYSPENKNGDDNKESDSALASAGGRDVPPRPAKFYPNIDLSIPESVYSVDGSVDLVWDLLRWEAYQEARREPLLVSFLYSTILNHKSLESSLAFLLANRLQSPAMMISTQLQSIILDALTCPIHRRNLRADMMAVRDRDPACNVLPDVFLYFKGFHALQTHRVANTLWNRGKVQLAQYLQSIVSQVFQIDIHPNATLKSGIMLDHGTGIVIGETATVGHNCSVLHHVTLGGSGKKGVLRHPQVGNGVLLGAGATALGPVSIGDGSQVGAGTLIIFDLPAHCVAVGVPARVIGKFVDITSQPSINMDQTMDDRKNIMTFESEGI